MTTEIEQLEAAIAAANEKLAELKAAEAAQAEKAWPQKGGATAKYVASKLGAEVEVLEELCKS